MLLVLVAIYYNFIALGSTIITALSKLLLVSLIFLFIHGSLPNRMYVYLPTFPCQYVNLFFSDSRKFSKKKNLIYIYIFQLF